MILADISQDLQNWALTWTPVLGVLLMGVLVLLVWKTLPQTRTASLGKLSVFAGALLLMGLAAYRGTLPRTR